MLFDTTLFVWFFLVVFVGFWTLVRFPMARVIWLLMASYAFYASWNPELVALIVFSTLLDYTAGKRIYEATTLRSRKLWLTVSLVGNLGLLGFFKYTSFMLESLNEAATIFGTTGRIPVPEIILPVGISFFTFQTMSYTIDIYRGRLRAVDNPLHFALFVAFFPQLVAGPIVRASDFLPQLLAPPRFSNREQGFGLFLVCVGLFKKVAIANVLAINLVDRVWENPSLYSSLEVLAAMHAYALQIYCDFSGYSDVAIGLALMLGFRLPENFNRPYISSNLAEFWRRWHISLSTWLRDYLYIPLGGNRSSEWNTYRNLFITMLLGGLWHGASWNFVLWGAMHGSALGVVRWWQRRRAAKSEPGAKTTQGETSWQRRLLSTFVTFQFVNLAWVLFRAPDFASAMRFLGRLTEFSTYTPNLGRAVVAAMLVGAAMHFSPQRWRIDLSERFMRLPAVAQAAALVVLAVTLQQIKGSDVVPFIYFQF